jgi:hypothetical protein
MQFDIIRMSHNRGVITVSAAVVAALDRAGVGEQSSALGWNVRALLNPDDDLVLQSAEGVGATEFAREIGETEVQRLCSYCNVMVVVASRCGVRTSKISLGRATISIHSHDVIHRGTPMTEYVAVALPTGHNFAKSLARAFDRCWKAYPERCVHAAAEMPVEKSGGESK